MRFKYKQRKPYERVLRRRFALMPYRWNGTTYWLEYVTVRGYWWIGSISGRWYWETEEVIEN